MTNKLQLYYAFMIIDDLHLILLKIFKIQCVINCVQFLKYKNISIIIVIFHVYVTKCRFKITFKCINFYHMTHHKSDLLIQNDAKRVLK